MLSLRILDSILPSILSCTPSPSSRTQRQPNKRFRERKLFSHRCRLNRKTKKAVIQSSTSSTQTPHGKHSTDPPTRPPNRNKQHQQAQPPTPQEIGPFHLLRPTLLSPASSFISGSPDFLPLVAEAECADRHPHTAHRTPESTRKSERIADGTFRGCKDGGYAREVEFFSRLFF